MNNEKDVNQRIIEALQKCVKAFQENTKNRKKSYSLLMPMIAFLMLLAHICLAHILGQAEQIRYFDIVVYYTVTVMLLEMSR